MKTLSFPFKIILGGLLTLSVLVCTQAPRVNAIALAGMSRADSQIAIDFFDAAENKVIAPDGAAEDEFGYSVALDGDTALIGARYANIDGRPNQGAVYVYVRSGTTWSLQEKLTTPDGASNDNFGYSVALGGDTALVGAPEQVVSGHAAQGAAYIFVRSGTTWTYQAKLIAADGEAEDRFGCAVALDGNTALLGAYYDNVGATLHQGSAYAFVRSGSTWTQQAKLTTAEGEAEDYFGWSVAISDDTALVGSVRHAVSGNLRQGAAYIYMRTGTIWTEQAQLTAADGAPNESFAHAVALDGDTALVGARHDDAGRGAAYAFTRSGTTWLQQAKLIATDREIGAYFGSSVALDGDVALIGADCDDVGANNCQGSAEVFIHSQTTWLQQTYLTAADGAEADHLGNSAAISGDTVIVGAHWDSDNQNEHQGSAYFFNQSASYHFSLYLPLALRSTP